MTKQFLRQTPFGIFMIVSSIAIFFIATSSHATLDFAQSEIGITFMTIFPISILLLEIFLRKLDRRSVKKVKASIYGTARNNYWTRPMGVDQPSASFKSLIKTLNQNINTSLLSKENQSFNSFNLWARYGN